MAGAWAASGATAGAVPTSRRGPPWDTTTRLRDAGLARSMEGTAFGGIYLDPRSRAAMPAVTPLIEALEKQLADAKQQVQDIAVVPQLVRCLTSSESILAIRLSRSDTLINGGRHKCSYGEEQRYAFAQRLAV